MKKVFSIFLILVIFCHFSFLRTFAANFNADEIYASVFVVECGSLYGSGFAYSENMLITNEHVVSQLKEIKVRSYDNKIYTAKMVACDKEKDIALLCVQNVSFIPLKIGDISQLKVGDDIYAIGAPNNMDFSMTKGIISNKERKLSNVTYLQIDAAVNEGNSGGPLLNSDGKVVGMNTLKLSNTEGIALAIPITTIIEFIEQENTENNTVASSTDASTSYNVEYTEEYISDDSSSDNIFIQNNNSVNKYLIMGLVLSGGLNIILVILLVNKRKKHKDLHVEQSENLDFEIEILE